MNVGGQQRGMEGDDTLARSAVALPPTLCGSRFEQFKWGEKREPSFPAYTTTAVQRDEYGGASGREPAALGCGLRCSPMLVASVSG